MNEIEEKAKAFDILLFAVWEGIAVTYTVHKEKRFFAVTKNYHCPITKEAFDLLKKYLIVLSKEELE